MVSQIATDPEIGLPISGIGGISTWRDALEHMLLGATTVQVCTAVMHRGFGIVEDMIEGLSDWMDEKGLARCTDFIGKAAPNVVEWKDLDLNYKVIAKIDQSKCIDCGLCYIACEDGCHQSIEKIPPTNGGPNVFRVKEDTCVGCNMCSLVCPAPGCITMVEVDEGKPVENWEARIDRTGGSAEAWAESQGASRH